MASTAFYVPELPGLPQAAPERAFGLDAGYLPARDPLHGERNPRDNAQLFFMLQRAMRPPLRRKLVIWLNGGPGCSSLDGAMLEMGAWRFDEKGALEWVPRGSAWNEHIDMLYVDQPAGTGFSTMENDAFVGTMDEMAKDFRYFLQRFVETYPEYSLLRHHGAGPAAGVDVYLAGESYAGQFIPYIAEEISRMGVNAPVLLSGIAIGNGFLDPFAQSGSAIDTLLARGYWERRGPEHTRITPVLDACVKRIARDKTPRIEYPECDRIVEEIARITTDAYVQAPESTHPATMERSALMSTTCATWTRRLRAAVTGHASSTPRTNTCVVTMCAALCTYRSQRRGSSAVDASEMQSISTHRSKRRA